MLAHQLKQAVPDWSDLELSDGVTPMAEGELYRSETLCVRSYPGRDESRWFVTFDHLGDVPDLDRQGFGEDYFRARGISVVTVVGCGNHWYQYSDMADALRLIRHALRGAQARIAYGSSMGGYAALRFADALDATACLALSPQYSNDPRAVPFERRWKRMGRSISWRDELARPIRCRTRPIIVYDPRDGDAHHARLIAMDTPLSAVAIPYAGHPATTYLSNAGLLGPLVEAVYDGTFDAMAFETLARARRKSTPAWLGELARRQPPHRLRTAEVLARDALSRAPDSDLLTHILAAILTEKPSYGEALQLHRRAYELSGMLADYGIPYVAALHAAGASRKALDIALELRPRYPDLAPLRDWIEMLQASRARAAAAPPAHAVRRARGTGLPTEARIAAVPPWSPPFPQQISRALASSFRYIRRVAMVARPSRRPRT